MVLSTWLALAAAGRAASPGLPYKSNSNLRRLGKEQEAHTLVP